MLLFKGDRYRGKNFFDFKWIIVFIYDIEELDIPLWLSRSEANKTADNSAVFYSAKNKKTVAFL